MSAGASMPIERFGWIELGDHVDSYGSLWAAVYMGRGRLDLIDPASLAEATEEEDMMTWLTTEADVAPRAVYAGHMAAESLAGLHSYYYGPMALEDERSCIEAAAEIAFSAAGRSEVPR
jgi:hypothetical protein